MNSSVKNNQNNAWQTLEDVLHNQQQFVKVHAAEYLIKLGKNERPKEVYLQELELHEEDKPYRIGIWRVLAMADAANRERWVTHISEVFGDTTAPDRLHALETLAKLGESPALRWPDQLQEALLSTNSSMQLYANWANGAPYTYFSEKLITDTTLLVRKISAYVLRNGNNIPENAWNNIAAAALQESGTSATRNCLALTALATAPAGSRKAAAYANLYTNVFDNWTTWPIGDQIDLAASLARYGSENEVPVLVSMMNNEFAGEIYDAKSPQAADLSAAAAYALLTITQKQANYGNEKK